MWVKEKLTISSVFLVYGLYGKFYNFREKSFISVSSFADAFYRSVYINSGIETVRSKIFSFSWSLNKFILLTVATASHSSIDGRHPVSVCLILSFSSLNLYLFLNYQIPVFSLNLVRYSFG